METTEKEWIMEVIEKKTELRNKLPKYWSMESIANEKIHGSNWKITDQWTQAISIDPWDQLKTTDQENQFKKLLIHESNWKSTEAWNEFETDWTME